MHKTYLLHYRCKRRDDDGLVAGVAALVDDGDVDVRAEAGQDARGRVPVTLPTARGRAQVVHQPLA